MKRVRLFDLVFERQEVRRQSEAVRVVTDIVHSLCAAVENLMSEPPPDVAVDPLLKDVILVVALGGIDGANKLAMSIATVPEQFADHIGYIRRIVNEGANKNFNVTQIQFLVSLFHDSNL